MSDLRYQAIEQLRWSKKQCEAKISDAKNIIGSQEVRLRWVNKYLFEKTPQELSIEEIESRLGHKVIIK